MKKTKEDLSDEIAGKTLNDCQKAISNNQSNLNPKGGIKWLSSGSLPFSSIRLEGVFTLEALTEICKILKRNRSKTLKLK